MLKTALPVFSREKLSEICNSHQIGKSLKFKLYGVALHGVAESGALLASIILQIREAQKFR